MSMITGKVWMRCNFLKKIRIQKIIIGALPGSRTRYPTELF